MKIGIAAFTVAAIAGSASAAIIATDLGTGAPPLSLGGYAMVAFGDDTRAVVADISSIGLGEGNPNGTLSFTPDVSHREIGNGWATWSNGYTGDVYYSNGFLSVTMNMAPDVGAFYFYAEPDPFEAYDITATAQDGTTITISVVGQAGANGYGFYGTAGNTISSITVSSSVGFALGEFGSAAVPAPGAGVLAIVGGMGLIARRRR